MQFVNFCKTNISKAWTLFVVLFSLRTKLPAIAVSLEVEPELEDVVVEMAAEAAFVRVLPFTVNYLECNVFIRWPCMEPEHCKVGVFWAYFLKISVGALVFLLNS